jgi:hypothetical protein
MLNDERLWWFNATQEQLTFLLIVISFGYSVLTFCRNHDWKGQRKDQEGTLEELKELTEFIFLAGCYVGRLRSPYKCVREEEEPLAVPKPRLRIRVLTMVEQIAVKNDYEREALELLKKQNFRT